MNKDNKNKQHKCDKCYQIKDKIEMLGDRGSYRCEPCHRKYRTIDTISSIVIGVLVGFLMVLIL